MDLVVLVLLPAAVLTGLGWWGRKDPEAFVPPYVRGAERERKVATMRRGALFCSAAGLTLAVAVVLVQL